jgi:hypothetical protein
MYKIRPNGNRNIILRDINSYISNNSELLISDEQFEKSQHIQTFIKLGKLIAEKVEDNNSNNNVVPGIEEATPIEKESGEKTIFVTEGNVASEPEGAFVRYSDEKAAIAIQEVQHVGVEEVVEQKEYVQNVESVETEEVTVVQEVVANVVSIDTKEEVVELSSIDDTDVVESSDVSDIVEDESGENKEKKYGKKRFSKKK